MANVNLKTQILLRNDTSVEWRSANPKLGKGEIGLETDTKKFKVGDGQRTWSELGYYNEAAEVDLSSVTNTHYEKPSKDELDAIPAENLVKGDTGVVKTEIVAGSGNYSYTAYVWNGTAWAAMDGNYSAEDIYVDSEITLAGDYTQVGNYKKGETISAGTSLSSILSKIFTKTLYPSKPTPSISMSLSNAGSYEVGTSITPSFNITYDPKTYTYGSVNDNTDGSTTGAAPDDDAVITLGNQGTLTKTLALQTSGTNKGKYTGTVSDSAMTVEVGTSYYGTSVQISHSAGYVPVNNLNQGPDEDTEGATQLNNARVVANSALTNNTDTSKITGYREGCYYGCFTSVKTEDNLTSADIRGLSGKTGKAYAANSTGFVLSVPKDTVSIVIACPVGVTGPDYVLNTTVNAPMTELYGAEKSVGPIQVGGADATESSLGSYPENYNLWIYTPANPYASPASLTVTLG